MLNLSLTDDELGWLLDLVTSVDKMAADEPDSTFAPRVLAKLRAARSMPVHLMIVRQPSGWAWRPLPPVWVPRAWWIITR
jgi:hypothetical protein